MFIVKVENGLIVGQMVDHRDVIGNPPTVTAEMLKAAGYMEVNLYRDHDPLTQRLAPCSPVLEGDKVYAMAVVAMTADDIKAAKDAAMANIRAQRNQMLAATDWRYRRDLTTTPDWDAYCKALRDLPATIEASGADPRTFNAWPRDPNWVDPGIGA